MHTKGERIQDRKVKRGCIHYADRRQTGIQTETKQQEGYVQEFEVYGCPDYSGCEHKARCLYKYNAERDQDKKQVMKINERWEDLIEKTLANI